MEERNPRRPRFRQLVNTSLYFHIPFCTKKCPYCHFYVVPDQANLKQVLLESLKIEWERKLPLLQNKTIVSIYFGGGTPTLFAPAGIGEILRSIRQSGIAVSPDCEITIEANPENASQELFSQILKLGVNRLSLGIQSLDERSLQTLERVHSAERARSAIEEAAKAGFKNISIDLMYDLPDQTEASWQYTLDQLAGLPIQHLSLYNLTIEPHTSFHKRKVQIPEGQISLSFLNRALEKLQQIGLDRYEISAFAKKGHESRHNLGYWTGRPFLGYGPSAFSYWEGERFQNIAHLQRYARLLKEGKSPIDFQEKLSHDAHLKERIAVQLRLKHGVDLLSFDPLPQETRLGIEKLKNLGFLNQHGSQLQLTERGMLFYDSVAAELI